MPDGPTLAGVIPAKAGIRTGTGARCGMDSRLRGNDTVEAAGQSDHADIAAIAASTSAGVPTALAAVSGAMRLANPLSTLPAPSS